MAMTRSVYSTSSLAVELHKDRRAIARALAEVSPDGKVGAHPGWHLLTVLRALGWIGRKVDGERLDPEQERARKDAAIANLHELKLAAMRREYVSTESVNRVVISMLMIVRTGFLAFPSRLTPFLVGRSK